MKHSILLACLVAAALMGCSKTEDPGSGPTATQAGVKQPEKPVETVRAPAPPPPAGGGKAAPEIPPEQLAKIREQLAKNPPQAPAPASAAK